MENEQGVVVMGGSHYVLSLGDKVYLQHMIDQETKLYQVHISFASAEHAMLHEDGIQVKLKAVAMIYVGIYQCNDSPLRLNVFLFLKEGNIKLPFYV